MTNEEIVKAIQNGFDVTENMQWLYQKNLPLIKIMIRPFTLYENEEDLLQEKHISDYGKQYKDMKHRKMCYL